MNDGIRTCTLRRIARDDLAPRAVMLNVQDLIRSLAPSARHLPGSPKGRDYRQLVKRDSNALLQHAGRAQVIISSGDLGSCGAARI
jgi:hypothetical protein